MMTFKNTFLEIIDRLHSRKVTGRLELAKNDRSVFVYFYDGLIDAASGTRKQERLGQYFLRDNLLTEKQLALSLRRVRKTRAPLGRVIAEEGLVEPAELNRVLAEQIVDVLYSALQEGFSVGAFKATAREFANNPLRLTVDQILLELARREPAPLHLDSQAQVVLSDEVELKPLPWIPEEIAVLTRIRSPISQEEIVNHTNLDPSTVVNILGVFKRLGLLKVVDESSKRLQVLAKPEPFPLETFIPPVENPALVDEIEVVGQGYSFVSEQFNALKVRLRHVEASASLRIINITSAFVEDGKSLVSCNLAFSLAKESSTRVLLVDGDLRAGSIHRKLGIPMGPGLVQYLLEGLDPQCYIRRVRELYVLTAGQFAENPIELFALSRMQDLMSFLRREFDVVIIDSPPLLPIADTRVISSLTDATIMVIRQGRTPYRSIQKGLDTMDRRKLLGVVFNGVRQTRINAYYSYDYYYSGGSRGKKGVIDMTRKTRQRREDRTAGQSR